MKFSIVSTDITPENPEYFSGYSRESKSKGVHDPLLLTLVTIRDEEYNLFLFSVDLLNVQKDFSDCLTTKINQKFPNSYNIVLISATHTHSGPAVFPLPSLKHDVNGELQCSLMKKSLELVSRGSDCMSEVTKIMLNQGTIDGFYGNRNQKNDYADKSFMTLAFMNGNNLLGTIVNLACHPTILKANNLLFSADIFGSIRNELEKDWSCKVLMLNGACGDSSSRFYSQEATFEEITRIGKGIAHQIRKKATTKEIPLTLRKASSYQEAIYYKADEDPLWIEKKRELNELDDQPSKSILLEHLNNKFSKVDKITIMESKQILFDGLTILSFSGEVTGEFAKEIYNDINHPVLIIGYEHGYISYMVDKENYGKYFESYLTRLPKGEADSFIHEVIGIAKKGECQ